MTLSLPHITGRFGVLALAAAYTTLTFGALATPAPVSAASNSPFYTAELAEPASDSRTVASGVVWFCEGNTCRAAKGNSRPIRICRGLSREFGDITSFTANGEALEEEQLAACNGK